MSLTCPRCAEELSNIGRAEACLRCGGVFLQSDVTQTVARVLDPAAQAAGLDAALGQLQIVKTNVVAPCPACRTPMRRYRFGPHLEVDSCHDHGSWYDKGELARLKAALEAGGVATEVQPMPASLELEPHVKNRPSSARPAQGGIDPGVQEKINELARYENWKEREGRRRTNHLLGGSNLDSSDYDALDFVSDVLWFLR